MLGFLQIESSEVRRKEEGEEEDGNGDVQLLV